MAQLPLSLPQGVWQHICVSWTLRDGVWKAYQGGKMRGRGEGLSAWHPIKSGGVLVLGQEQVSGTVDVNVPYCVCSCVTLLLSLALVQDTLGGRFDASQALVGELSLFNLWDRVLSPTEVAALAACAESALLGNVVPWTDRDVDVFGGAVKEPLDPCVQTSHPRQ